MIFYQLKKNCDQKHPYPPPESLSKSINWRFYAKLFYKSFVIFFILTAVASTIAKAQNITIKADQERLRSIMDKIEKQSGYDFWYNKGSINESEKVSIEVKNQALETVLRNLFNPRRLNFELVDKTIFLKPTLGKMQENLPKSKTEIQGIVVDTEGKQIPNATIQIKATNLTTIADDSGAFKISSLTDDGILIVSSLGFSRIETPFSLNNRLLKIVLPFDENKLEDVQVVSTGYQNIPKERATGSFAQPVKEMFDARIAPDVVSRLSGITSGLLFNSNTVRTTSGQSDINIRGRSTIFANDQPLIILDNFPFNGDLRNINPNDIENVTILKDAAAASIWGVRAGNGVIVITTKQGKKGESLNISLNANLTIFNKPNLNYNTNQLDPAAFMELETFFFLKGYYDSNLNDVINYPVISPVVELLSQNRSGLLTKGQLDERLSFLKSGNVNTDLNNNFYRNAIDQQYALGLSGGTEKITYRFSVGYDRNLPPAEGNAYDRITLTSAASFMPVKNLILDGAINAIIGKSKTSTVLSQIAGRLFPYDSLIDDNGNPLSITYGYRRRYLEESISNGFLDWQYRPLQELSLQDNHINERNIRLSTGAKYTIIRGLSAELKYLYQNFSAQGRNLQSIETYFTRNQINRFSILTNGKVSGYNFPLGGILSNSNTQTNSNNLRGQLNYGLKTKQHELNMIVGYEISEIVGQGNSFGLTGYNSETGTFANVNTTVTYRLNPSGNSSLGTGLSITGTTNRLRSSFTNGSYTYNGRYTLSGSARIDGSNYFGVNSNQKNVPLWSIGGKWQIDQEPYFQKEWLSVLNLRATHGFNGNLDASVTGITTLRYVNNATWTNQVYAVTSNIGNPDLRWERSAVTNIGIDFASTSGRISGSFDYFSRKGTDLIGFKNFVPSSGISSLKGNYSDMKGNGLDIVLKTQNLQGHFQWSSTFLMSLARDRVTRYDIVATPAQVVANAGIATVPTPVVGNYLFGIYSYRWSGLNGQNGNPVGILGETSTEDYLSITTKTPVSDLVYHGSARPTFFGGLNNIFHYGPFTLAVQINFKLGYFFRKPTVNYSQMIAGGTSYLNVNADYNLRWQNPGDELHTVVPSIAYPFSETRDRFFQYASVNVERADHIRLQDISLAYELDKQVIKRLPFKNLQFSIYANNIGILWRATKSGLDPDAVPGDLDRITLPPIRSIAFGIKGNF